MRASEACEADVRGMRGMRGMRGKRARQTCKACEACKADVRGMRAIDQNIMTFFHFEHMYRDGPGDEAYNPNSMCEVSRIKFPQITAQ